MKKRFVAFILGIFMLISIMMPFSVLGAEKEDVAKNDFSVKKENKVNVKGISPTGSYGNFTYSESDPDNVGNITITKYKGSSATVTVPNLIEGKKVTKIGQSAFYNNQSLITVNIPSSVKIIDFYAFQLCKKLKNVNFSEGIEEIHYAFYGCNSIKSVKIPDSIKDLDCAFINCKSLSRVTLPKDAKGLKMPAAFKGTALKNVVVPNGVVDISSAFNACFSLKKAILPKTANGLKMDSTFDWCPLLETANIPNGTVDISYAFRDCASLKKIVVPNSVTNMNRAFGKCSNLVSANISKNAEDISKVFYNCKKLKSSLTIPKSVTKWESAIAYCGNVKNVKIENGIKSLDYECLYGTGISSLNIPNSVKSIGTNALSACKFKQINIPNSVVSIDNEAFSYNFKLEKINIPYSVENVGENIFEYCKALKSVNIENKTAVENSKTVTYGLKVISKEMLKGCSSIKKIVLPKSVTSVNPRAFYGCKNLEVAVIPKSVTWISGSVFDKCSKDLVIQGIKGSYAEKFAKSRKIPFVSTKITKVALNKKSFSLGVGTKYALKTKVAPSNASYKAIKWMSSNKKIATVSSKGKVLPKKVGKVKITAKAKDGSGKYAKVLIKVVPAKVKKIKISSGYKRATINIKKTKGAKKYDIYRSTKKNKGFKKIKTTSFRKYINTNLKSKKTYYYKVRAIYGSYKGSFSKVYKVRIK
ncbi:leucine-rich repeat protein [uncultured Anaerofustis sp.]|uniref:leucine-rich repeat protein n=1 Tax=uncultured Anaerofustis sp. TaxID=904996 RepID=UPI0025D187EA|nr:leucine-rich repeat protein [uncultured Anaerofustis sp.]